MKRYIPCDENGNISQAEFYKLLRAYDYLEKELKLSFVINILFLIFLGLGILINV